MYANTGSGHSRRSLAVSCLGAHRSLVLRQLPHTVTHLLLREFARSTVAVLATSDAPWSHADQTGNHETLPGQPGVVDVAARGPLEIQRHLGNWATAGTLPQQATHCTIASPKGS